MNKVTLLLFILVISFRKFFAGTIKNIGDLTFYKVEKDFITYYCKGGEEIRLDVDSFRNLFLKREFIIKSG